MFFQGTLGSFMAYSQIGGSGAGAQPGPQGQPPGAAGSHTPPQTTNSSRAESDAPAATGQASMPRNIGSADSSPVTGKMGNANRG